MNELYQSADVAARGCLERLLSSFPDLPGRLLDSSIQQAGYPLIGLEVEVKWSSFFPDLASKFFADGKTFFDLDADQVAELTKQTTISERLLKPALERGLQCGLGQGKDRYWEHVLPATTDPNVMLNMLTVMRDSHPALLPPGKHALHITIGEVTAKRSLYFGLFALELVACDADRIMQGFNRDDRTKPAGWAKKGNGGVFSKVDWNLEYDDRAVELRTLYLDTTEDYRVRDVIRLAYKVAGAVRDLQANLETPGSKALKAFMNVATKTFEQHGLPDENWLKPSTNPIVWERFAKVLPELAANSMLRDRILDIYSS